MFTNCGQGDNKVFNQRQQFTNTQAIWILVIALLTAVALFGGAFFFGTALSADTVESVAPSPLGSSLTAVRESISKDYVERLRNSSAAARSASLAALAKSRADFDAELNNSAAAATSASAGLTTVEYAAKLGIPAAVPSVSANREERSAPFYAGLDKGLRDQGIRPSARSSSGMAGSSAAVQSQWIKPEGIKLPAAVDSVTTQSPWIKPEGIRPE
jgi:hypothetical protein